MRLNQVWIIFIFLVCSGLCACGEDAVFSDDLTLAHKAYADRNIPLAERLLERYLHEEQDSGKRWEAWSLLIKSLNANGQQVRATLECLDVMLDEYDDDAQKQAMILAQMGKNHEILHHYDDVVRAWSAYIELPDLLPELRIEGLRRLAAGQFAMRHFEAGEETLQQCLALPAPDHDKINCMLDLADVNMAREHWAEVADLCQQILDSDPDRKVAGLAGFLRADALEQMGKLDEALAQFEAGRDSYPNPAVIDNRIEHIKKNRNPKKESR